jgi:hypothetical protein
LCLDGAARVDNVARPVEFAHVHRRGPGLFRADPIDGTDEDTVGRRRCRLLELPEILAQARNRGRRVDDVFGPVQRERPPAFGEMAVIADVDAEFDVGRVEYGVAGIA